MRLQSRLVHLKQVHPLEGSICENLCNLWENILQEECNPWEAFHSKKK